MSKTSTLDTATEYADLLATIEDYSAPFGNRIASRLPRPYRGRRTSISLKLGLARPASEGTIENFSSEPIVVTGWSLQTAPFFVSDPWSDPRTDIRAERRSSIFATSGRSRAEPINRLYFGGDYGRREPFALLCQLRLLASEMHDVIVWTTV